MTEGPVGSPVRGGRESHAIIVAGPEGSGKRAYAVKAAGALLCVQPEGGRMCGHCPSCAKALAGGHPDLIEVKPAKATLGVDDVRDVLAMLSQRPYEGGRRAVILHRAESMTPQAQNALLRTLEEPGRTTFYLLCADVSVLLPTVRSRCQLKRMLPDGNLAQRLVQEGAAEELANEAAMLSGYAPEKAREILESDAAAKAREVARRILSLRSPAEAAILHSEIGQEKNKEIIFYTLDMLEVYASDILRFLVRGEEALAATPNRAGRFTIASATCIINRIIDTRKRLSANVSWQNASDALLMEIARAAAKGETI